MSRPRYPLFEDGLPDLKALRSRRPKLDLPTPKWITEVRDGLSAGYVDVVCDCGYTFLIYAENPALRDGHVHVGCNECGTGYPFPAMMSYYQMHGAVNVVDCIRVHHVDGFVSIIPGRFRYRIPGMGEDGNPEPIRLEIVREHGEVVVVDRMCIVRSSRDVLLWQPRGHEQNLTLGEQLFLSETPSWSPLPEAPPSELQ